MSEPMDKERLAELEARVALLQDFVYDLKGYVEHGERCTVNIGRKCNCGLSAVYQEYEPEAAQEQELIENV